MQNRSVTQISQKLLFSLWVACNKCTSKRIKTKLERRYLHNCKTKEIVLSCYKPQFFFLGFIWFTLFGPLKYQLLGPSLISPCCGLKYVAKYLNVLLAFYGLKCTCAVTDYIINNISYFILPETLKTNIFL